MEKLEVKRSLGNYLEAILTITGKYGACRMTDIAEHTGYSKSRVCTSLKKLEENGCIIRDGWRILLTETGAEIAECIHERQDFLLAWFRQIGISAETAAQDACLIEHDLSTESFEKIRSFLALSESDSAC